MHPSLLQDDSPLVPPPQNAEKARRREERLARWRERQLAKGFDADDLKENRAFDQLMVAVRSLRRDFAKSLDLTLPENRGESDVLSESEDEVVVDKSKTRWL